MYNSIYIYMHRHKYVICINIIYELYYIDIDII